MTVIEQFEGIQVKLHTDEVVPVAVVNKAYCSQAIHTIHTKERMGMIHFPGYLEISFRPNPKKDFFFFALDPLALKRLKIINLSRYLEQALPVLVR